MLKSKKDLIVCLRLISCLFKLGGDECAGFPGSSNESGDWIWVFRRLFVANIKCNG